MKNLFIAAFILVSFPALAQSPDDITLRLTVEERRTLLVMCDTATWAARRMFDGYCEQMKKRFDAAETADKKPASDKP